MGTGALDRVSSGVLETSGGMPLTEKDVFFGVIFGVVALFLRGVDRPHRGLVSAKMGKLGSPRCRPECRSGPLLEQHLGY